MKREDLKSIQVEFCRRCEKETGKKNVDECFNCLWHKKFNVILSDMNGH